MTRSLTLSLLLLCALAPAALADRQRSVHVSAPSCSYSLSVVFADPVSDTGLVNGRIVVTPSVASCTSWNAFSPVDWIMLDPGASPGELSVTVKPNTVSLPRQATVRIAGRELVINQLAKPEPPLVDGGIMSNPFFNTDLSSWIWLSRFPIGAGTFQWSPQDANGSLASGSLQLRSTNASASTPGMQRLQCVNFAGGGVYQLNFAYRMLPTGGVTAVSVFELDSPDCSDPSANYAVVASSQYTTNNTTNWRRAELLFATSGTSKTLMVVFGTKAQVNPPFDAWIDDVIVKQIR
jgi:hypothetical protein